MKSSKINSLLEQWDGAVCLAHAIDNQSRDVQLCILFALSCLVIGSSRTRVDKSPKRVLGHPIGRAVAKRRGLDSIRLNGCNQAEKM
jgi:hypothetical protein